LLIFYLSSQSTISGTSIFPHEDKLLHFIAYSILYFLFLGCFKELDETTYLKALVLVLLYSISDEIHQHFVVGRDASIADIIADMIGAVFIMIVVRKSNGFFKKFIFIKDKTD